MSPRNANPPTYEQATERIVPQLEQTAYTQPPSHYHKKYPQPQYIHQDPLPINSSHSNNGAFVVDGQRWFFSTQTVNVGGTSHSTINVQNFDRLGQFNVASMTTVNSFGTTNQASQTSFLGMTFDGHSVQGGSFITNTNISQSHSGSVQRGVYLPGSQVTNIFGLSMTENLENGGFYTQTRNNGANGSDWTTHSRGRRGYFRRS